MPIKAHVKGKRKAPPPPLGKSVAPTTTSDAKSSINHRENAFPNGKIGNAPETMACFTIQKRKKPAPLPPIDNNITAAWLNKETRATGDEMNNLSAISKRAADKSSVKAINLNIFEPNHIHNDFHCSVKETNEVNVNLDIHRTPDRLNDFAIQRNDQVWICNYCTLQNPFWKIICDACERIKPYNTPTVSIANLPFVANIDNDSAHRSNEKNELSSVMMRPKTIKPNNDVDKILNRNSMYVDIKSASSSAKELPNKRNSLCLIKYGDQNISPETLEMEKERIRAVIRAMNSRAMAQKYPAKAENHFDARKKELPTKIATINKPGKKRNGLLKYDIKKDYNFPVRPNVSKLNDLKEDPYEVRPIKKIENTECATKRNGFNGNTDCDETSLANTQKKLETDANEKRKSPTTATKHSIKCGIENEISVNLYINFNNAVEAKIHRDMSLDEFKAYIFKECEIPCKNQKIYFNGLLLKIGEQSLAKYGVTDQSSLYINTENVVVQAVAKSEKKSVVVQTEEPGPSKYDMKLDQMEENVKKEEKKKEDKSTRTLFDDAERKNDGEKYLIEHIQLNRYTIERVAPRNDNINKVKYRGVYNYNPRCNPEITKILSNKPVNPIKRPVSIVANVATQSLCNNGTDKPKPISEVSKTESVTQLHIELLSLDDSMDLTKNIEVFECSVCMVDYQPYEGLILRNCLHTFCKDCIRNTIIYSDEAEVKCPYIDNQYSCDCLLQDREIKALLSKTEYDEHLAKSLRIAENQIENSFHCKTPDCKGWCIYEDDVNTFKCPICRLENCLTCRVIHDGLDCKQYQNMMKNDMDKNPENATTHAMLQEMIENGEAMNCPACKIVLMKKWGCDWLKCSMCKTEICWITRGYRWGPAGKGDTSAGCKCGVNGFRCHPKCNYCH